MDRRTSEDMSVTYDRLIREADSAYLIDIDGEEYWMPKSQTRIYESKGKIYAPVWLLNEKGLI